MKYTVVVPANQATRREFNNLRKAKEYLKDVTKRDDRSLWSLI